MKRSNLFLLIILVIVTLCLGACSSSRLSSGGSAASASALEEALQNYQDMVLHMNNGGIANLFAEQGELINPGGAPIRGRESIRKFLNSFTEYKVIEENLQADSTVIIGASAMQIVHYHQKVTIPSGKTIDVSGWFKIDWVAENGRWLIRREENLPAQK